jgi:transposase-like protein
MEASAGRSAFAGFRFPQEVISVAVRWYLRYGLSYRDVEELLAERGVSVDHVSVYRWVQRFTVEFIEAARPARRVVGDRWFVDETYVKMSGQWTYLYRTVDQHGQVIDVLLSTKRDLTAARAFFTRALSLGAVPVEVTNDRARFYPRVLDELARSAQHTVEQPDRSRPRATQSETQTDAWSQATSVRPQYCSRARVRSEPAPKSLRHRHRHPRQAPTPSAFDDLAMAI